MKVLIACEESQRVCLAFREKGFSAFSCDIQECSGGRPDIHIKGDVTPLLNGSCTFFTQDGEKHYISKEWDLIIAHPPCTFLTNSGNKYFDTAKYGEKAWRRMKERNKAISFFYKFVLCKCAHIAIENPCGIMSTAFRKPDMMYNPYDFEGETESKRTCLWLKNLPLLKSSRTTPLIKGEITHKIYEARTEEKQLSWNDPNTAIFRSKTPIGVAKAMADQWGEFIMKESLL